jgi:menaquinone-dependent protoporphyrinogen oxidase
MRVLVGYASAHGSTAGIAEAVARRLGRHELDVDVRSVAEVDAVDHDAVVLGSAVHSGAWLPPATAFVHDHVPALAQRPVWLFSVSSVGETTSVFRPRVARLMRRLRGEPKGIDRMREAVGARGHRNFAGIVQPEHWGRAGTLFLKALGGSYGDHRDWADIDDWADRIAAQLATGAERTRAGSIDRPPDHPSEQFDSSPAAPSSCG